jgi:hypothetical protein
MKWHMQEIVLDEEQEVLAVDQVHQAPQHAAHHKLAQLEHYPEVLTSSTAAFLADWLLAQAQLRRVTLAAMAAMAAMAAVGLVALAAMVAVVVVQNDLIIFLYNNLSYKNASINKRTD